MKKKINTKYFKSILLLLISQATIYALIKFVQGEPNLINTTFDQNFPFITHFIWVYDSWYPFLFISLYFLYDKDIETYKNFFLSTFLAACFSFPIFVIYPTTISRPEIIVNDLSSFALNFTYSMDTPINCLPSMHCVFCFTAIFAVITGKNLPWKYKIPVVTYLIVIILSTMFVKQHVIYDVIGAFVTATIGICLARLKIFDKFKKTSKLF